MVVEAVSTELIPVNKGTVTVHRYKTDILEVITYKPVLGNDFVLIIR